MIRYLRVNTSANQIVQWKSKGLSDEGTKLPPKSSNFLNLY